jgi:hypothetical protein
LTKILDTFGLEPISWRAQATFHLEVQFDAKELVRRG